MMIRRINNSLNVSVSFHTNFYLPSWCENRTLDGASDLVGVSMTAPSISSKKYLTKQVAQRKI